MSAVKDNNFIAIQGWMRTKLNLKGNELLIYALIYGFSQDGNSSFKGSRKYIADWCGCSLDTVDRSLGSLINKGLLAKYPHTDDYGNRLVDYVAIQPTSTDTPAPAATQSTAATQDPWACHTTTNTTQTTEPKYEPQPLLDEPQAPAQPKKPDPTEEVVNHLNHRLGTQYKTTTQATRKLIKARLKEGFTVEDMKLVIDKKATEWAGNPKMAQFLRPDILFGNKFEGYLNAKVMPRTNANAYANTPTNPANQPIDAEGHMAECTRENGWF